MGLPRVWQGLVKESCGEVVSDEIRKALDRKRDAGAIEYDREYYALSEKHPDKLVFSPVFSGFAAGFDAACNLYAGMPEALEWIRDSAHTNRPNGECADKALANFKARVGVGDE